MSPSTSLTVACLLIATSCSPPSPPTGSKFLTSFNPAAILSKVGGPDGITYSNPSTGESAGKEVFSGVRINKSWTFSFQGSDAQLLAQLDRLRVEVKSQLSSSGCAIGASGDWSGDFSGFNFEYSLGGAKGFVRVTGVSFKSGRQGLDILVYEQ